MAAWYDCILLKSRMITAHEERVMTDLDLEVRSSQSAIGTLVAPKGSKFLRPLCLTYTHHYHINAIVATMAWNVSNFVKPAIEYSPTDILLATNQAVQP